MELHKFKLGDICVFNKESISYKDNLSEIAYLDTSSITENRIEELQYLQYCDAPIRAKRKVRHNTIVYSSVRPRLKHYGIIINPPKNLIISTGFITIDIKKEFINMLDAYYLFYYLTKPSITEKLANIADTAVSAYPSINPQDLSDIIVECPNLIEQKKIAQIMLNIDRKIALNRAINHTLEAMAKPLNDYWFVQFDFPNADGKPYKSSGGKMMWNNKFNRELPSEWTDGKLIDIATITMGQSPDGSSYNEDGNGTLFYQGSTDFGVRFPSVRQYTTSPSRMANKGDILMSVRAPVGAMNIANNDCCIGRGLSALNSKIGSITHLYYILNDLRVAFEQHNAAGTTFGSITKDDLHNLPVIVPPNDIMEKFEKLCQPMFDIQMKLGEEIEDLIKLREELLPLLMNGQVSVNYDLT